MNTKEFFDAVLPAAGRRCIAARRGGKRGMAQMWGDDNAWAADCAQRADQRSDVQVFHACAGFGDLTNNDGRLLRTAENVVAVRAFWLDIDAGPDKPYADARAALVALAEFCRGVGLPTPLVVLSGLGVHAYWPLVEDITPAEWKATARLLKAATTGAGLRADPTRTGDIASVLRPPGTHHKKGEPLLVRARAAEPIGYDAFHSALAAITGIESEPDEDLGALPDYLKPQNPVIESLAGEREFAPSLADRVADRCAIVRKVRDPGDAKVSQPTWYHVLGVLSRCEDGQQKAHDWSSKDTRYDIGETQASLDRAGAHGPTTCAKLAEGEPELCAACPHNGKIKSPIALGADDPKVEVPAVVEQTIANMGFGTGTVEDKFTDMFPGGFGWGIRRNWPYPKLWQEIEDADGNADHVGISETLFYPVNRLREDEEAGMEIEMIVRGDEKRRFTVPSALIGEGGSKLHAHLAKQEIIALPGQKPRVEHLFGHWVTKLKAEREAIVSHSRFGWHEKNFLIGTTMLTPGGRKEVIVRENAAVKAGAFLPVGSLDEWVRLIDTAYNYPGQEAYQFMVLCAFAAPLLTMFRQYGGVTVYAHSEGTGVGKTTAQRAGLSAFGDYRRLQLADGQTTYNALIELVGTYHNVPVMFDELTNQNGSDASRVVYDISSGRAKERLTATGKLRHTNTDWSTIVMASGNNLLSEKLGAHRGNAEAEISRLFEFTVANTSRLSPNDAAELFPKLLDNYGHAGLTYMEHIVRNYDAVRQALAGAHRQVNDDLGMTQAERFWSALFACVRTAHAYTKALGIIKFPGRPLMDWMGAQLGHNRGGRDEAASEPTELFGRMLTDLWVGVLVTRGEGDLKSNTPANILVHPHGRMTGRMIEPGKANERRRMLLSAAAAGDWCVKHGVSAKEMFNKLVAEGIASAKKERVVLGRGTAEYGGATSSPVMCWSIDTPRAEVLAGNAPLAAIVTLASTGSG